MTVAIENGRAVVTFQMYDLDSYRLFLRVKQLPERDIAYDWRTDTYTVTTPARYASMLDASLVVEERPRLPLAGHLFDYQEFIVRQALDAKRYAVWADTGLGKTAMLLEFARAVRYLADGRVLIFSPTRELIAQTRAEWDHFYPDQQGVTEIRSRVALEQWLADTGAEIGICTYALMSQGVLPELRNLAGLILDESSILKSGGGTIKWNVINSTKGIEYKLSCTATPAPNDTMEYASQAAFLEVLRNEGEILWTYFTRDKYGNWSVKPHARKAFYEFMASWSIYLRDPAHYGFADILSTLPPPVITEHPIEITEPQRARMQQLLAHAGRGLFDERLGMRERAKLSQIAKGFEYVDGTGEPVESRKPAIVGDLVRQEVAAGRPTIVWTVFDEESEILVDLLRDGSDFRHVAALHGSMTDEARADALASFRDGRAEVLVSKASLIGYGLNLQRARAMVFSGFDDSFERMYQAIRRAYRFGQTETVHVHVPVIAELEGLVLDNLKRKQQKFDDDVAEQEANYLAALRAQLPKEAAA